MKQEITPAPEAVCTNCGELKPASEFSPSKTKKNGLQSWCKLCKSQSKAEYRASHPEVKEREAETKRKWRKDNAERVRETKRAWRAANPERKKAADRAWRLANPDKVKAAKIADYERNREKRLATAAQWYVDNADKVKADSKAWAEANPERKRAADKAWRDANPERTKANAAAWNSANPERRRAISVRSAHKRRVQITATHEFYEREEIFELCEWICKLCDLPVDPELAWPDPMSKSIDHIVPLSRNGDDTPDNVQLAHLGCNSRKHNKIEAENRAASL